MVFGPGRRVARRTARRTSRRVARRQQWLQQDQEGPPADSADYGEATPDPAEELQKMAELHKQGVLTDEEFAAKKKQILGI
jgi:Short C-terminal domain